MLHNAEVTLTSGKVCWERLRFLPPHFANLEFTAYKKDLRTSQEGHRKQPPIQLSQHQLPKTKSLKLLWVCGIGGTLTDFSYTTMKQPSHLV